MTTIGAGRKMAAKQKAARPAAGRQPRERAPGRKDFWRLRLYIAGQTPNSILAISNLKRLCEERLKDQYQIEIIDLMEKPQLAKGDQIVAIPTLVRRLPAPMKKIIGNLSEAERTLIGLDLRPVT